MDNQSIKDLKAKDTETLLGEIQRIAFEIRMWNMARQEEIDARIRILRARNDPRLWVGTEYEEAAPK